MLINLKNSLRRYLSLLVFVLYSSYGIAQSVLDVNLSGVHAQSLPAFLQSFERQHQVRFFFVEDWLAPYSIDESANGKSLHSVLSSILKGTDITFEVMFGYAVIFVKD